MICPGAQCRRRRRRRQSVSVVTMCPAVVNLMSCWSPSMSACDVFMVVVVGGWVSWLG